MRAKAFRHSGFWGSLTLAVLLFLFACSEKAGRMDEPLVLPSPDHKPVKLIGERDSYPEELEPIYFDYDVSELKPEAMARLRENARWLDTHPDASLQIEGHCDERGGADYNINLGQERANAARDYLIRLGVQGERLTTISYGAIPGQSKKSWSVNRKAAFLVFYPSR
jgi:peptidoglycan-associated lipoprotein